MDRSIELTAEQWQAVAGFNAPIRVSGPGREFVLLTKDTFERMQRLSEAEEVDPSFVECEEDIPEPS